MKSKTFWPSLWMTGCILLFVLGLTILPAADTSTVKSADGTPIVYQVQGKGDVALVFVHCWCCDKGYWDAQVPYFAKKYKVVTLDLAGHGDSGQERAEYSMETFAQDVLAVIKELKLGKMILIGHSMGGPVIAHTAALIPDQVIGLIGVDTFIDIEQKMAKEQFEPFLNALKQNFAATTRGFIGSMLFTSKANEELKEKIIADMSSGPANVGVASMEAMQKMDLPGVMDKSKMHLRCIDAEKFNVNVEAAQRHTASFAYVTMKDVGHFLHMEDPTTFNKLLEEAIEELLKLNK